MILGLAGSLSEQNAEIAAYSGDKHQLKGSISASLQRLIPINNWAATLSLRKELIEGYQVPLCPLIGASGNLNRFFSAQLHLSRNFRVPTLNDRYWQPGGNGSLKPETSWSAEAGINWKSDVTDRCWQTGIGITAYYSLIRDLILWTPGDNSFWSPENIQEVLSRGLELSSTSEIKVSKFAGKLHLAYSYTPSEFNKNETGSNSVKGNQLTYIPLHNAMADFRVSRGGFFIDWEQSLLGKRYVLKDNSMFLDGYSLGNLKAGCIFSLNNIKLSLQGEIRNLFDTDYQSIQYYAVPGRSFRITINVIL
jgi:iron complex outermembrane receptor protein